MEIKTLLLRQITIPFMRSVSFLALYFFLFQSCTKTDSPSPTPDPTSTPIATDTLMAGWQLKKIDSTGKALVDMVFVDATTGFACGEAGIILKTVNGGSTWLPASLATGLGTVFCNNSQFLNTRYGFVASTHGVFRTTDGGTNWIPTSTSGFSATDVFFVNPSTGFCTTGSGLRKSVDSGKTWINVSTIFSACSSLWFVDTVKGFVTANGLYKTVNSGTGFSQVFGNVPGSSYSPIYFANAINGCAGFGTNLYITNDGGTNWSLLKQFSNSVIDVKNVNASEYYVSTQTEIWHTTDGGNNWVREVKMGGGKIAVEFTLGQPGHVWICCSNGYVCYK